VVKYIPEQGDIVILTFDSQSGHEQKGRRPAIVVSNQTFNQYLGLAYACPITSREKGFPFHVRYDGENISGFIMTEQMKSIDYSARKINFIEKVDQDTLAEVLGIVDSILE